jgi:hypothetical protein
MIIVAKYKTVLSDVLLSNCDLRHHLRICRLYPWSVGLGVCGRIVIALGAEVEMVLTKIILDLLVELASDRLVRVETRLKLRLSAHLRVRIADSKV